MDTEIGHMDEYTMHMSQPGSNCPDDSTISLVNYHDYKMTGFKQTMDMCDGMEVMSNRMVCVAFACNALCLLLMCNDCVYMTST